MEKIESKVLNHYQLQKLVEGLKSDGKSVVFTNGCFDILHYGHIDYLEKAKDLGDFLVVAINTDESVKKLKGANRPINQEYDRARIIAALGFVDAVTLFDDDTPKRLIEAVLPSVLVKGSDYTIDNIVGAKEVKSNGGEVKTIDFVEGYSSTAIINKIIKNPS